MDDRAAAERGLKASQYFLENRDFDGCRKYALRAQQSSPDLPAIAQILAVADVHIAAGTLIAGTQVDWYSVLQVNRFSTDTQFITDQFNNLLFLLNPNTNKFMFAAEAFDLVCNAWAVLSDPIKRYRYDKFLRNSESKNCTEEFGGNGTFWTICPYCYFVYEFARVYEDCCLKCQNEKCGKAFHAVEIASPPLQVVENGNYKCVGFYPSGFGGDGGNDSSSWTPFVPKKNNSKPKCDIHNAASLVDITDDSDNNSKGEKMKVPVEKPLMKRKKMKSIAKISKKLTGRGTRIEKNETFAHGGEQLDLNNENGGDDQDFGSKFVEGMENSVQIFEENDDIFIGLHEEGF